MQQSDPILDRKVATVTTAQEDEMDLMGIYSERGTKVRYAYPEHGMECDHRQCSKYLEEGKVYTVKSCTAYSSSTSVELEEVTGQTFNSVMFAPADSVTTVLEIHNLTDEPVQYRVLGPRVVEPPADEPRFGDRLREIMREQGYSGLFRLNMERLADAIDQDAARMVENARSEGYVAGLQQAARHEAVLRDNVEEAVERLRYTVITTAPSAISGMIGETTGKRDVLDAEPFLAELDRIFGDRPEPENANLGGEALNLLREIVNSVPASYDESDPLVRRHARALQDAAEWLRADPPPLSEHEPASERRERQAARYEDHDGKVEGVDR